MISLVLGDKVIIDQNSATTTITIKDTESTYYYTASTDITTSSSLISVDSSVVITTGNKLKLNCLTFVLTVQTFRIYKQQFHYYWGDNWFSIDIKCCFYY